jgi:putative isomerase
VTEYNSLKARLARGWNTWNTRSVLSHVLLPEGFALNLGIREYAGRAYLKEALIGRRGEHDERIHPGPRTYDGGYTELNLKWRSVEVRVQSATTGDDLVLLITPLANQRRPALLTVESGLLWNRPGHVALEDGVLVGHLPDRTVRAYATQPSVSEPYVAAQTPYLALPLDGPVGISTGKPRTVAKIQAILDEGEVGCLARAKEYGSLSAVYSAVQTCMAWDTIYEPAGDRVVSPVSRLWNVHWGGFALFDWDTYFAAYMAALDNRDLAYANAIEITRERTERGFIPNFATVNDVKSRDRSQPPVGSTICRELYRRFGDHWFLEEVYDHLLEWNRWWVTHRDCDGLLCWGSDPYEPTVNAHFEVAGVYDRQGAAYESGLDNSPMYDDVPFSEDTHLLELADVGLNGMYVMDCEALADVADVLGRSEAGELRERAQAYRSRMASLWDEEGGILRNRRTDTGAFSHRLSPTNFYALLARAVTPAQAERMVAEHFYNPDEFWGEWIMPSIARNDPAYPEQDYWRGRIWAPMNFLVYLGLRRYDLPRARADLAERSKALLLKEWTERGHVHENYNGDTGEGCDKANSDRFYHWGGLLGSIAFIEAGFLAGPEEPLDV